MLKKILLSVIGLVCGVVSLILILKYHTAVLPNTKNILPQLGFEKPEIIGFLPYWLANNANKDYSSYINTISYFSISIDADGSVVKFTKPTESEQGWFALKSEKINSVLNSAKEKNMNRSLVIFSGDQEKINQLVGNPVEHGQKLMDEVSPILTQYGFTDLNIDIESVSVASDSARQNFTLLTKTIYDELQKNNKSVTLSIDVSPTALIKPYMIDVPAISVYVNKVIFMDYDFHYQGSYVTGAVSPVNGAGVSAEFDTETSIKEALKVLAPEKIIMGVPLYGYEWETLLDHPHAAVIPGSGMVASNKRVEKLLTTCATCSAQYEPVSQESYLIYKDQDTNTFHQIFYPDKQAMQKKIDLIKKYHLGGIALWALGYEGDSILEPLKNL